MTKEERIQEAYGIYYNPHIDQNGWFDMSYFNYVNIGDEQWDEWDKKDTKIRPKSLQGIENNNGWIKIEDEDDLPKEDGFYWVVDSESKDIIDRYFDTKSYDYFNQFSTHYQPITKPQPPLY